MITKVIETGTDLSFGDCAAEDGSLPTRCLLKDSGYCKKHEGHENMECSCPLDKDGTGIIVFVKIDRS